VTDTEVDLDTFSAAQLERIAIALETLALGYFYGTGRVKFDDTDSPIASIITPIAERWGLTKPSETNGGTTDDN